MVTRAVATLLGTLLMAGSVLLLGASPAQACRCAPQEVAQQARAADLVVTGTVEGVQQGGARAERGARPREGQRQGQQGRQQRRPLFGNVTLAVAVDRIYSGQVPDPTVEVTTALSTTACGLGRLPRGERYVFFLTADQRALRATSCNGTTPATERAVSRVEQALGEGRAVEPGSGTDPDGEPAADLTVVDDSPAPDVARTALPGGLLAVAGLVGLVVLGRVGSRR